MAYNVGQMIRLPVAVRDINGVLTNATMSIEVRRPDDTVYPAPGIVNDSTGNYHADVIPDGTNYGPWTWTYTAAGAVTGVFAGQFFVRIPGPRIVSAKEVLNYLRKAVPATTVDEDVLLDLIDGCRWVLERITGPVVPRNVVEYHDGGGRPNLHLRTRNVISVVEVVETWGPGDIRTLSAEPANLVGVGDNNFLLRRESRTLVRRSSGYSTGWPHGTGNIKVTTRVGRVPMPDNVRSASLELISHVWRASQLASGGTRPREGTADLIAVTYAVPNRVKEMLGEKPAPRLGG